MKSATNKQNFYSSAIARRNPGILPIVALLVVLCFAAISGLAIGFAGKLAAAGVTALILGLLSIVLPIRHLVSLLLITAFLIMGQLIYFAGVSKAFWMPLLLGLVLLIRFPAEMMRRNTAYLWQSPFQPKQSGSVRVAISVFFAVLIATSLINLSPALQLFVSGKEYLFLWGLYVTIAAGLVHPGFINKIWNTLPWLLPLQFPIVLYQRFFIAARRSVQKIGAAWDAVVGAFGGDPNSGGMSGAMGLFTVICITLCIVRWRSGLMKTWQCILIVSIGLMTIALAEVKFAVLVLPVAIMVAYLREFLRRPVAAIGMSVFAGGLAIALLSVYQMEYWSADQEQKVGNYEEQVFSSSLSSDFVNMETGEMGRVAAITFWASAQKNAVGILIGQGMGASRKGETVVGEAAKHWPFDIARSSLAIFLWETGVIGTLAYIAILIAGILRAYNLISHPSLPEHQRTLMMTCASGLTIVLLALPYNTDALVSPQMQIMTMLFLGQIAMSGGWLAKTRTT